MKNILIHLNPDGFDRERAILARIQVDNSLALGWDPADLLLVTNFPWEYNGVRATVIEGTHFCSFKPRSTNTVVVPHLFELGLIKGDGLNWVHDFDAYQLNAFDPAPDLGAADVGLTTYGWMPKWNLGSFFFTSGAADMFQTLKGWVYSALEEDERVLRALTRSNLDGINARIRELNITYNFGMRGLANNWGLAEKPLRVLHFHPWYREKGLSTYQIFIKANNELGIDLMGDRLRGVFKDHGIT